MTNELSAPVVDAIEYHKAGWAVLPIQRGKKRITVDDWRSIRYANESDIQKDFVGKNIGVILGAASGNLIDIDLDEPIAAGIADILMPDTLVFGRKGKPKSHRLYVMTDWSTSTKKYYDPLTKSTLVEMRGDGGQTIFPGSTHVSGEAIEWDKAGTCTVPTHITREQLTNYVNMVASATVIAKYWPNGARHDACLALAGWLIRNNIGADEITSLVYAITSAAKDEDQRDRLAAVQTTINRYEEGENIAGYPTLLEKMDERVLKTVAKWLGLLARSISERLSINTTDEGNAERLVNRHAVNIRYCVEEKSWYVWDNRIWKKDIGRAIDRLAAETAKSIFEEAAGAATQDEREQLAKWAMQSNNITRLEAMVKRAASMQDIQVSIHDFNTNAELLTLSNGTFDLDTETLLPFDREHMITKKANAVYDANAPLPYLVSMVRGSIDNKDTLITLNKGFGLAISGKTDKAVFFCYGPTDTGKTTLLTQGLQYMLGDYAKQVSLEAIVGNKDAGKSMWLADIHGARFALASEPPSGFHLDSAAIKAMTGDSTLKARALYEMPFDSKPVATMFIDTNYRPEIPEGDDAIWNRLQLVHFKNKVKKVPGEPGYIPNFKEKISEVKEMSGLLNWCIFGYRLWQDEGFTTSEEMENDKREYRADNDIIGQFISQCVEYDENAATATDALWDAYRQWEKAQGITMDSTQKRSALTSVLEDTHKWARKKVAYGASTNRLQSWLGVRLLDGGTDNLPLKTSENEDTFPRFEE